MPYKDPEKQRESNRRWYLNNKEKQHKANREQRAKIRKWFQEYKSTLSCEKCGENHVATLDFHHINPEEKEVSIGLVINSKGWGKDKILAEIEKCQVLCANCHRKLHYEEMQA